MRTAPAFARPGIDEAASVRHACSFVAASLQHAIVALLVAMAAPSVPAPRLRPAPLVVSLGNFAAGAPGLRAGGPAAPAPGPATARAASAPPQTVPRSAPVPLPSKPAPRPATAKPVAPRAEKASPLDASSRSEAPPQPDGPAAASPPQAGAAGTSAGAGAAGGTGEGGDGGAGIDGSSYRARVLAWLDRHKRYPARARAMGLEGRIVLRLEIDRSGRVQSHSLEGDGRYAVFTQEAESMLERAGALPEVPPTIPGDTVEMVIPIDFRLEQGSRRG